MIDIGHGIVIPKDALVFSASRSGGPGGQNVNKVSSRVTVFFDVANCDSVSADHKRRILSRLATRASKDGVIRVAAQRHRTQKANRQAAIERLAELLREALQRKPVRRKTPVPFRTKAKRLEDKRRRSLQKQQRSRIDHAEG